MIRNFTLKVNKFDIRDSNSDPYICNAISLLTKLSSERHYYIFLIGRNHILKDIENKRDSACNMLNKLEKNSGPKWSKILVHVKKYNAKYNDWLDFSKIILYIYDIF
jgi:hypothetical protein